MVRGKPKQVLSETELQGLKDEKADLARTRSQLGEYGDGTKASGIDRAALERQEKQLEQAIRDGSPSRVSGVGKDRMAREAEELGKSIQEGMPTRDEMEQPRKHPGAIRKHMNWEAHNAGKIQRWKQLQRTLGCDPTQSTVESLRRK